MGHNKFSVEEIFPMKLKNLFLVSIALVFFASLALALPTITYCSLPNQTYYVGQDLNIQSSATGTGTITYSYDVNNTTDGNKWTQANTPHYDENFNQTSNWTLEDGATITNGMLYMHNGNMGAKTQRALTYMQDGNTNFDINMTVVSYNGTDLGQITIGTPTESRIQITFASTGIEWTNTVTSKTKTTAGLTAGTNYKISFTQDKNGTSTIKYNGTTIGTGQLGKRATDINYIYVQRNRRSGNHMANRRPELLQYKPNNTTQPTNKRHIRLLSIRLRSV